MAPLLSSMSAAPNPAVQPADSLASLGESTQSSAPDTDEILSYESSSHNMLPAVAGFFSTSSLAEAFQKHLMHITDTEEYVMRQRGCQFGSVLRWLWFKRFCEKLPLKPVKGEMVVSGAALKSFMLGPEGGLPDDESVESSFNDMYFHGAIKRAFTDRLDKQVLKADDKHYYKPVAEQLSTKRLYIKVISARNLLGKDASGFSDPFVSIEFGQQRVETTVIVQNLNPTWNEEFDLGIEDGKDCQVIDIHVWDWDQKSSNDFLGKVAITIGELRQQLAASSEPNCSSKNGCVGVVEQWFPLQQRTKRSHVQGDVCIRFGMYDMEARLRSEEATQRSDLEEIQQLGFLGRTAMKIFKKLGCSTACTALGRSVDPTLDATLRGENPLTTQESLSTGECILSGLGDPSDFHVEMQLDTLELYEDYQAGLLSGTNVSVELFYNETSSVSSTPHTFIPIGGTAKQVVVFGGEVVRIPLVPRIFLQCSVKATMTGMAASKRDRSVGEVVLLVPNLPVLLTAPDSAADSTSTTTTTTTSSSSGSSSTSSAVGTPTPQPRNLVDSKRFVEMEMLRITKKRRCIRSGRLRAAITVIYDGAARDSSSELERPSSSGTSTSTTTSTSSLDVSRRSGRLSRLLSPFRRPSRIRVQKLREAKAGEEKERVGVGLVDGERDEDEDGVSRGITQNVRIRTVKYVLADPKDTLAIERQSFPRSFAANYVDIATNRTGLVVEVSTSTPTVSYGKTFVTALQFCLGYVDDTTTKLVVSQEMVFVPKGAPASFVRSMIRKFATKGTRATYVKYAAALNAWIAARNQAETPPMDSPPLSSEFPEALDNVLVDMVVPVSLADLRKLLFDSDSEFVRSFYSEVRHSSIEIGDWEDEETVVDDDVVEEPVATPTGTPKQKAQASVIDEAEPRSPSGKGKAIRHPLTKKDTSTEALIAERLCEKRRKAMPIAVADAILSLLIAVVSIALAVWLLKK